MQKTTKSYSLDADTSELIARALDERQHELMKQNIFSAADLLRAALLKFLEDWFAEDPGVLENYLAQLKDRRLKITN